MKRKRLKNARNLMHLTLNELAVKAGITRGKYSLIECGLRCPTYGLAVRLAECLTVPVERLFSDLEGFKMKHNNDPSKMENC